MQISALVFNSDPLISLYETINFTSEVFNCISLLFCNYLAIRLKPLPVWEMMFGYSFEFLIVLECSQINVVCRKVLLPTDYISHNSYYKPISPFFCRNCVKAHFYAFNSNKLVIPIIRWLVSTNYNKCFYFLVQTVILLSLKLFIYLRNSCAEL